MKVIMAQKRAKVSVYETDRKGADLILDVAKRRMKRGIYALEHDGVVELINMPYIYKQSLKKKVAEYVRRGFKVYYNGG